MLKAETGEAERMERERKTGLAAHKNKDYKAAIRHLERARKIWPDDFSILVALAGAYLNTKDYQKSITVCEHVAQLGNERPEGDTLAAEAFGIMSNAFLKLGDSPHAIKSYHESLAKYHGGIFRQLDKSRVAS